VFQLEERVKDDYADDDLDETCESRWRYCEDCRILTDALRDMEQQCREAEDKRFRESDFLRRATSSRSLDDEQAYLTNLAKLQRRRDSALEVLLKHQSLEHK